VPVAAAGLLLAGPIIALAAAAVAATSGTPVLFRQSRVGRDGRLFTMYKLRTMTAGSGGPSVTAAGDRRITGVGRLLRQLKIDELPELWNVVRGDMRLVGPRPEVPGLVDLANPLWQEALRAAPGITDPMTLQLRDEEAILRRAGGDSERFYRAVLQPFKLCGYVEYQRVRTWRTDLGVLVRTAAAVVRLPGTSPDAEVVFRRIAESGNAAP
jgi:lipopolysaccharide/colanic/teichoic acid biosynthesis glycosyltransferase